MPSAAVFYLHVCYLVLLPVVAFHLVLLKLLPGLHVLVIIALESKSDGTKTLRACLWTIYFLSSYNDLVKMVRSLQSGRVRVGLLSYCNRTTLEFSSNRLNAACVKAASKT